MATALRRAELEAEAAQLRARGLSLRQIADHQGCTKGTAYNRLQRAYRAVQAEAVDELRRTECDRLDAVIARLWDIVDADHPYVGNTGKVVLEQVGVERDEDGIERLDMDGKTIPVYRKVQNAAPVLAALNGIVRAAESKRRLLGLDAPTKAQVHVITEDMVDARLRQLDEEWAALNGEPTRT